MANTFKNNPTSGIGTTEEVIYTAPAGTTATVIGLTLANTTVDQNVMIAVKLNTDSTSDDVHLVKNAPVPVGSSFVVVGGSQKVVVEEGQTISVVSSYLNSIDALISVLEVST